MSIFGKLFGTEKAVNNLIDKDNICHWDFTAKNN